MNTQEALDRLARVSNTLNQLEAALKDETDPVQRLLLYRSMENQALAVALADQTYQQALLDEEGTPH